MEKKEILRKMFTTIFLILAVNFFAMKLYWYTSIWWFDIPMHFFGGFFLGLLYIYLFELKISDFSYREFLKGFLFILIVGLGWEIFEIIFYNILNGAKFIMIDTLSDICFDVSGGLSAIIFLWRKN